MGYKKITKVLPEIRTKRASGAGDQKRFKMHLISLFQ